MKNLALAASLLLASALLRADAFSIAPTNIDTINHARASTTTFRSALSAVSTKPSTPCDIPTDVDESTNRLQDASALRNAIVTNIEGDFVPLSRAMGEGDSIVIFLRHMG
mmetsp:Transcript_19534/g.28759  ORF Transcript_19534/g.28759 Transcript_19534/m.28759 type:complete len:110 (-) Transcript_19534:204-533(-)